MKRIIVLFITMVMILSSISFASASNIAGLDNFTKVQEYKPGIFNDIDEQGWYIDNLIAAYELGLMKGADAGKFNPDGDITLIETITMATRIHKIYNTGKNDFVQGNPWYQVYVDYAVENGIIDEEEYSDLNVKATRKQFAYIMYKALPAEEYTAINTVEDNAIPDVSDSIFTEAIYMLYRAGILTGNDAKGTFTPNANIGRSSVAAIATRMIDKSLRKSITLIDKSFRDVKDLEYRIFPWKNDGKTGDVDEIPNGNGHVTSAIVGKYDNGYKIKFEIESNTLSSYVCFPGGIAENEMALFDSIYGEWHKGVRIDANASTIEIDLPYTYFYPPEIERCNTVNIFVIRFFEKGTDVKLDFLVDKSALPKYESLAGIVE